MAAFGAKYRSSALAQEKTGEFWVNARLLGLPNRAGASGHGDVEGDAGASGCT
jgi:hypothetical protein